MPGLAPIAALLALVSVLVLGASRASPSPRRTGGSTRSRRSSMWSTTPTRAPVQDGGTVERAADRHSAPDVKWVWASGNQNTHDVRTCNGRPRETKAFHSELAASDYSYSQKLVTAGTYRVYCSIHTRCGCAWSSRSSAGSDTRAARAVRARRLGSRRPWPARPPSSAAPTAATPSRAGTAGARAAARGTRSSRRPWPRAARARRGRRAEAAVGGAAAAVRPSRLARRLRARRSRACSTGIGELDRVLGGGHRARLARADRRLAGHRQVDAHLDGARQPRRRRARARSTSRARSRRRRSGCAPSGSRPAPLDVPVLAETDLDAVLATLEAERPEVCVIDSVQTLHAAELSGAPGSVGQVREVAGRIMRVAKARDIAVLLVGHVTKEGALAGPRVLEHLVDCVLQFEGERERTYRTLRALKNRFGSTNEAGVFEMRSGGLVEVARRLGALRRPRPRARRARVVLGAMEGSRPLLVEVQALVSPSRARAAAAGRQRDRPQPPRARARRARPPRRRRRRAAPTSSSTSSAACASTSRAPTSRSRSRWPAPRAASRWAAAGSAARLLRRARPDRRAALGRPTPTGARPRRRSSASARCSARARRRSARPSALAQRRRAGRGRARGRRAATRPASAAALTAWSV